MSDRELLEAAAKAIGMNPAWYEWDMTPDVWGIRNDDPDGVWNPLTDDGDALRLAVKLRLHLNIEPYGASARRQGKDWNGCESHIHGGLEAATRRAIVRAAAEIGKAMP